MEFVGRGDGQVKIRGYRVELAEIELAIGQFPGVSQAVVEVKQNEFGSQLTAFVLANAIELNFKTLEDHLLQRLPKYMVPSEYCIVEYLPQTASGKVDRRQLSKRYSATTVSAAPTQPIVPSSDPIIDRLLKVWGSVLESNQLTASSNFFECGGDSLAAAILFSRLEKEFGKTVSISKLVAYPTVAELAKLYRHVEAPKEDRWDVLVPLHTVGTRPPLFCLPGIDGHLFCFRALTAHVSKDRPVYGLQPYGLDGISHPISSIEEIAEFHISEIRKVMPNGPYHLVGFSFGGVLAFEVTQQLRRQGEKATLAMIDAWTGLPKAAPIVQSLIFHLRLAANLEGHQRWLYLVERVKKPMVGRTAQTEVDNT